MHNKNVQEVVEVAHAAKEESGITFCHFNTGWQKGKGLVMAPFVKAIKEQVGLMVGVQAIPATPEITGNTTAGRLRRGSFQLLLRISVAGMVRKNLSGKAGNSRSRLNFQSHGIRVLEDAEKGNALLRNYRRGRAGRMDHESDRLYHRAWGIPDVRIFKTGDRRGYGRLAVAPNTRIWSRS